MYGRGGGNMLNKQQHHQLVKESKAERNVYLHFEECYTTTTTARTCGNKEKREKQVFV